MKADPKLFAAADARLHAVMLRGQLSISDKTSTAIILGTGWGDALRLANARSIPMAQLPGFSRLGMLAGHRREVEVGELDGREIVVLRGRIHLNEHPTDPAVPAMVRLQTEMLCALGMRTLILTAGVGGLRKGVQPGDLVVVDGFCSLFAPPMPLFAGEFEEADVVLDPELIKLALRTDAGKFPRQPGGYAMLRGPNFESRKYDKRTLRRCGMKVVGMSMLPEACVAMLFKERVRVLALGYVTNNDVEEHSHQMNVGRAKGQGDRLSQYLASIVQQIHGTNRA
jgi:purine-nucleoside phosphorylase